MDEFNTNFDPTDEYESIESEEFGFNQPFEKTEDVNATAQPPSQEEVEAKKTETEPIKQKGEHSVPMHNYQHMGPPPFYPFMPQFQNYQPVYPPTQYGAPVYMPYQPYPYVMPPQYAQPQQITDNHSEATINPYAQQNINASEQREKKKTPLKAKIFLISMLVLLVAFVVTIVLIFADNFKNLHKNSNSDDHPLSGYATEPDSDYDNYSDDLYYDYSAPQYESSEIEFDITLQADEGQTQNSTDGKGNNSYPANKDASKIKTYDLPKDKDNSKYTTQSAYNAVTDSVVTIECYDGQITGNDEDMVGVGSGTIITSDGYIVTNSHVIANSKSYNINVVLSNAKEYKAKVVGFDARTDIAVIKIDAKDLKAVKFADSSQTKVGQDIVAIGNPGGTSFQNSLTKGIVSAVERELELSKTVKYIQTDAAINPGNSGGPLCNIYGQVIGINTAKLADVMYEGMGFAIPSNTVLDIANDLIRYGYVKERVRIGIMGLEVNEEMIFYYDLPNGVLITEIDQTGPFADSEAQKYDVITAINGVEVSNFEDIFGELEKYKAGDEVTITVYRLEY